MSDFGAAIERAVFIVGLNAGVRKISAFSGTTTDVRMRIDRVAKSHDRISTFLYTQSLVVFHRQSCGTQEQSIID